MLGAGGGGFVLFIDKNDCPKFLEFFGDRAFLLASRNWGSDNCVMNDDNSYCVMLSGVSSFIGFSTALAFKHAGKFVVGGISKPVDEYPLAQKKRLTALQENGVILEQCNLDEPSGVTKLIEFYKPKIFVHHAAWTTNAASLDFDLKSAITFNLAALEGIFESCSSNDVAGVILTGSNAEYPSIEGMVAEDTHGIPASPYGLSKLTKPWRRSVAEKFKISTIVLRIFNPLGAFDNPNKLVPSVIRSLSEGEPIELTGCQQSRDFIAISELTNVT